MAFDKDYLTEVTSGKNNNAGSVWKYISSGDTVATITGSSYFNDMSYAFNTGDVILIEGSDDEEIIKVTSARYASTVTTESFTHTGIDAGVITNTHVGASAAIDFSKLAALTDGNILVGSATNVATSVAVTGDIAITNAGVTSIAAGVIVNADVNASAGIEFSKLAALTDGNILVGSATNVATSVAVTGDIAITNAGVTSIAAGVIVNADVNASAGIEFSKLESLTDSNIIVGSATNVPTAVAVTGDIAITNAGVTSIAAGVIVNADINASAAIDFSKLAALTDSNILVGSATNVATAVAVTGDIAITNAGVTSIAAGVIVNADVNASAGIEFSKLEALADGNIIVGSALTVPTSVAMSGDVTINNAGVTSISAGVIVDADIDASAAIDFTKLAPLADGSMLVGDATNTATVVTMSGDVTMTNTAVTSISAGVIVNADINAAAAIDFSKLAALADGNIIVGSAGTVPTSVAMSGDATLANTGALTLASNIIDVHHLGNATVVGTTTAGATFVIALDAEAAAATIDYDLSANADTNVKFEILHAWAQCTATNAGGTATVYNAAGGGGLPITDPMAMATVDTPTWASNIAKTAATIAAGTTISVVKNAAGDDGYVYLLCMRVV